MIIELIDWIYIGMISVIFSFIVHIEFQLKALHAMMDEHCKCELPLSNKKINKNPLVK